MAFCPQHSNCLVCGYVYSKYRWDFGDSVFAVLQTQGQCRVVAKDLDASARSGGNGGGNFGRDILCGE
jgi:hypothetical protein